MADASTLKPLRKEFGGDGRTLEDALKESKDPVERVSLRQTIEVQKFIAKWAKLGVEVEFTEPEPTQQNVTTPITRSTNVAPKRTKRVARGGDCPLATK